MGLRLRFELRSQGGGTEKEEKKEKEEKFPLCGEDIGQRPLRGRCPKRKKKRIKKKNKDRGDCGDFHRSKKTWDGPTDGPTGGPTDMTSYRDSCRA